MLSELIWQCPRTKKIFSSKKAYVTHLKKLAKKKLTKFNKSRNAKFVSTYATELRTLTSFAEIECWILKNSKSIVLASGKSIENRPLPVITSILFTEMKFKREIANTHNAPIGQKTWSWRPEDNVKYYPGWKGRVQFTIVGNYSGFTTDLFRNTGICFGTGSGRALYDENMSVIGILYSADVYFFAADWPGLAEMQVLTRLIED